MGERQASAPKVSSRLYGTYSAARSPQVFSVRGKANTSPKIPPFFD
jgi:hypothetical protein